MDAELRAELLALRALLLLTLGEVANLRPDTDRFLAEAQKELVRALGAIRIEPEAHQAAVRASAVAFAQDWFSHIHFHDEGQSAPY